MTAQRRLSFLLVLFLAAGTLAGARASAHTLSGLVPIRVLQGLTRVLRFAPDGRPGIVTMGWRDTGGNRGFNAYLVLLPPEQDNQPDWNVVGIQNRTGEFQNLIRDDPGDGKQDPHAIRFAHGVLDGKYETMLLVASKDAGLLGSTSGPTHVTYDIYKLSRRQASGESTLDYFAPVDTQHPDGKFCSAEVALAHHFDLPISKTYAGAKSPTGCP